jgi:hypothetical protein
LDTQTGPSFAIFLSVFLKKQRRNEMNQVLNRNKSRSFSSPRLTKYVILMGIGVWMLALSAIIASFNQEKDSDWHEVTQTQNSSSESVASQQ